MSEPNRPAPSTAPTSPESSGSEAAQRAAGEGSGKLEDRLREHADNLAHLTAVMLETEFDTDDVPDFDVFPPLSFLRRAADALEAARELLGRAYDDTAWCTTNCGSLSQGHTPDCPWARLRTLLGEEGER